MAEGRLQLPKIRTSMEMSRPSIEALTKHSPPSRSSFCPFPDRPKEVKPQPLPKPEATIPTIGVSDFIEEHVWKKKRLAVPGREQPPNTDRARKSPNWGSGSGELLAGLDNKYRRRKSALLTSTTFLEDKQLQQEVKAEPKHVEVITVLKPVSSDELDESSSDSPSDHEFNPVHLRNQLKLPPIQSKRLVASASTTPVPSSPENRVVSQRTVMSPSPKSNYLSDTSKFLTATGRRVQREHVPERWFKHLA